MKKLKWLGAGTIVSSLCLLLASVNSEAGVSVNTAGKQHIGTFDGSTTFTTSSSNGINPGLFIEVRDKDGKLKQYTSEEGVITVPNTKEGAYVTQAKLLGKTKYVDQDTGEILDEWEEGRNLKLESPKMPVLTTTGGDLVNLFDANNVEYLSDPEDCLSEYYEANSGDKFSFAILSGRYVWTSLNTYDSSKTVIHWNYNDHYANEGAFIVPDDERISFVRIKFGRGEKDVTLLNRGETPYVYDKTNILTVNEDVELCSIGDVKDELNLLTGEMTKRLGVAVMDGSDDEVYIDNWDSVSFAISHNNPIFDNIKINSVNIISDKYVYEWIHGDNTGKSGFYWQNNCLWFRTPLENIGGERTQQAFKTWLQSNPITSIYELDTPPVKTVDLTSTHEFNLISDSVVQIKGEALPTIYSITVPSEPLTFAINPNAEEGQKFIAPDFSITNESKGPVFLELKSFEQITSVFNDVLPEEHDDWVQLTKDESKDIALALVPINSDGWLTLNEGEKYVANSQNIELGGIRAGATVDFSFNAYHGRVFDQNLFPEYRLVFTFGF